MSRQVECEKTRPSQRAPTQIPEVSGRRQLERGRVEEAVGRAQHDVVRRAPRQQIGPLAGIAEARPQASPVETDAGREGRARKRLRHAVQVPASKQEADRRAAALPRRPGEGRGEDMRLIEVGEAAVRAVVPDGRNLVAGDEIVEGMVRRFVDRTAPGVLAPHGEPVGEPALRAEREAVEERVELRAAQADAREGRIHVRIARRKEMAAIALDFRDGRVRADQLSEEVNAAGPAVARAHHGSGGHLPLQVDLPARDVGLVQVVVDSVHRCGRPPPGGGLEDIREPGAAENQDPIEERRGADAGDGQFPAPEQVEEHAAARSQHGARVPREIPGHRASRREVVGGRVLPQRPADGCFRVAQVIAERGDLAVDFGRRRNGLVADSQTQAQAFMRAELVLREAEELVVAPTAHGVGTRLHHFGDARTGLQEQGQRIEGIGAHRAQVRALVEADAVVAGARAPRAASGRMRDRAPQLIALQNEPARPRARLEAAHVPEAVDRDRAERLAGDERQFGRRIGRTVLEIVHPAESRAPGRQHVGRMDAPELRMREMILGIEAEHPKIKGVRTPAEGVVERVAGRQAGRFVENQIDLA